MIVVGDNIGSGHAGGTSMCSCDAPIFVRVCLNNCPHSHEAGIMPASEFRVSPLHMINKGRES